MKPVIGIVPLVDEEKESYWMLPGYMKGIEEAGGVPFMLPLTTDKELLMQLLKICDGLLLTGGHDVSPELYGEKIIPECGAVCKERDIMEGYLFDNAVNEDMPVLGICRGIQFMNVALGGSLYQDIPLQLKTGIEHHQSAPYDNLVHSVSICRETPLYELLNTEEIMVNSYHHQGIKKLSDRLKPMAYAPDGLVEAVYMPDKNFIWGVQFHPEFAYLKDETSRKIFSAFINSVKEL